MERRCVFIPLHDANHLKRIRLQYVTLGLIALNVAVFLVTFIGGEQFMIASSYYFGFIPSTISGVVERPADMMTVPDWTTFLSYAFFHGNWLHLGGNMLFLWVFGDNVEDAMGHLRFLIFYCACAIAGGVFHYLADNQSQVPLIGASGAVAGIVAAYLILHPRVHIWVLAFGRIPLRLPAWIVLAAWIVFQFGMFAFVGDDEISFGAHIGGIICGSILIFLFRRTDTPLLDARIETPHAVETYSSPRSVPDMPRRPSINVHRRDHKSNNG